MRRPPALARRHECPPRTDAAPLPPSVTAAIESAVPAERHADLPARTAVVLGVRMWRRHRP
ncbi:hypothetical protein AB0J72_06690 [Dactylosporangium sp. NPDC049742]|uniref:hypothetical protein n=1 Tax=Dactylosporangium sp. NPDC049742 TaxID=3154737 RepID=UPI003420E7FD